jgi:hypothetical protein
MKPEEINVLKYVLTLAANKGSKSSQLLLGKF